MFNQGDVRRRRRNRSQEIPAIHVLRRTERRKQTAIEGAPLIFIGGLKTLGGSGSPARALALV